MFFYEKENIFSDNFLGGAEENLGVAGGFGFYSYLCGREMGGAVAVEARVGGMLKTGAGVFLGSGSGTMCCDYYLMSGKMSRGGLCVSRGGAIWLRRS